MVEVLNSNIIKSDKLLKEVEIDICEKDDRFKAKYIINYHRKKDNIYWLYEEKYNEAVRYILPILKTRLFPNYTYFSRDNMLINAYFFQEIIC